MGHRAAAVIILLAVLAVPAGLACDGTVFQSTNPVTGNAERVCPVWDGHDYEIYWYEQVDGTWSSGTQLTDNSADDIVPVLAFDASGSTGVVWRRSGANGRIYYRGAKLQGGTHTWQSAEVAISDGARDASGAWVVFAGDGTPWVGWHEQDASGFRTVMGGAGDGASPWPTGFARLQAGLTSFTGNLQLESRAKNGHVWLVWVDSGTELGYSEWDASAGAWGPEQHEPYSGSSDIPAAKQRVEDKVAP